MTPADKALQLREKALRDSVQIFKEKRMEKAHTQIDALWKKHGFYGMFECIEEELFTAYMDIEQYKKMVEECIIKNMTIKEYLDIGE